MSAAPAKSRVVFPRLNATAFQHYEDVRTTDALKRVPVFAGAMKFISERFLEKAAHLHHLSHCIRLGPEQGADLYRQFVTAAEALSIPILPELYLSPESSLNAYAIGMKQATIILTRGIVESMSPVEILAVMGHELGHVKCEHMVNKTVASLIAEFGVGLLAEQIPFFGPAAMLVLQAHLMDWSRKAELSCDRASLLVVQDASVVASVLAKLGGWPASLGTPNLQALMDQARDYDALDNESVAAALKMIQQLESAVYLTHPLPVHRVQAVLRWAESDQYRAILAGDYEQCEMAVTPRCGNCGEEVMAGDSCCTNCGEKLDPFANIGRSCANCGSAVRSDKVRHCGKCGHDLRKPGAVLER